MESQIVKGNTKIVGLIGNPVAHSISPLIHNHAFRKLNLPYVYIPLLVQKENLHHAMYALRSLNFAGANVTIPYKTDVVSYCDKISDLSQLTGTVNTLYFSNGLLFGTTTDAEGFFCALDSMNHEIDSKHIIILGNGGTAKTLGFAVAKEKKIASLTIAGRNRLRVENLSSEISEKTGFPVSSVLFDTKECFEHLKKCSLLINCTSVGMYPETDKSPLPYEVFHSNMVVFDVIYNPAETQLVRYAKEAGCFAQNGMSMLLYQGLASFKYWTGVEPTRELFDIGELQSLI